jgi:PKD repeat protein
MAQAKGLQKLIQSLPSSAFKKRPSQKNYLMDKVKQLLGQLEARQYDKAIYTLENNLIQYFDGCAGGDASNDYIISCDDKEKPYAVAIRIVKTIQEISGVLLPPVLDITATPTSGDKPLAVAFTATATDPDGTVLSYYWDFGNGANSILQNASSTYTCPGTFTATCAVIDNDGLITQKQVNINVAYPAGVTAEFKCDLFPAYNSFCAKVCHYTGAPYAVGAGVNLSGGPASSSSVAHANLMAGRVMPDGTIKPLVIPGDPDNSPIVQYTEAPRYHAHDVGGERLNDDVRVKQRAWILEGAQNN